MSLVLVDDDTTTYTLPLSTYLVSDSLGQSPGRTGYATLNAASTWVWAGRTARAPAVVQIEGELGAESFAALTTLQETIESKLLTAVQLRDTSRNYYVAVDGGVVDYAHQTDPFTSGVVITLWPTSGAWSDIVADALWQENASYILQETGDKILLDE